MSDDQSLLSRRNALKCMAYGGAGTLFALSGGVFTPIDLAMAASDKQGAAKLGKPLFVQISDTHIGFNKEANPDVSGTLTQTIDIVNGMSDQPALIIHLYPVGCRNPGRDDSSAHGRNDRRPVDSMIGKRNSVLRLWVSHRAAKLTQGNPQLFARAEQACLYRA